MRLNFSVITVWVIMLIILLKILVVPLSVLILVFLFTIIHGISTKGLNVWGSDQNDIKIHHDIYIFPLNTSLYNVYDYVNPFLHSDSFWRHPLYSIMTPFDACVVPQLKRFDNKMSASDLKKLVSNMKRIFMKISDLNFIDEIFIFTMH